MAKLPDHIDKNDKRAVAEYFIKLRYCQEHKAYYDEAIAKSKNGSVDVYGDFNRYNTDIGDYLISEGYKVQLIAPLTWRISKDP